MEKYDVLFTLKIEHDYYRDKQCRDIGVGMSRLSERMKINRKWIFRQVAVNEWQLFGPSDEQDEWDEGGIILDIVLRNRMFACFTDLPGYRPGYMFEADINAEHIGIAAGGQEPGWEESGLTNRIGVLKLRPNTGLKHIVLVFFSRRLRWEYVFISRDGRAERQLELTDVSGQLRFGPMERMDFCGIPGWGCITEEPVLMRENDDYVLRLFEVKPMGRKLLCKSLESPQLGRFVAEDAGVVRQVVYY